MTCFKVGVEGQVLRLGKEGGSGALRVKQIPRLPAAAVKNSCIPIS